MSIRALGDEMQMQLHETTQQYGSRPLGVGVVLAGYDTDGPHIVRADPSGDVTEMHGTSIGVGSESVKEYLEENVVKFENERHYRHCWKEMSFKIMENDEVAPHLAAIAQ